MTLTDGRNVASPPHPFCRDGSLLGQVAVLRERDVLSNSADELKSEFVATVSSRFARATDLHARGYTTMLPMVGQLNPKQTEFNQKIMIGIGADERVSRSICSI